MSTNQETMLLTIGEGSIDPSARIQSGEISSELLDEMDARLRTDEFYDDIDPDMIPCACVDGRGDEVVGPCAAGGTFSLVMGDALADQSLRQPGEKAPAHAKRVFTAIKELGKKISGHSDTHAHGPNCGCGAEDKLDSAEADQPSILGYIVRRGTDIRDLLDGIGVVASDQQHEKITTRAQQLRDEGYATTGAELRDVTLEVGGENSAPALPGVHVEGALVIDTRVGKALNRKRLHDAFDGKIDTFYLNVPALQKGTELLAASPAEANDRFIGALYYNVGTASTLASNLRIVVL